MPVVATVLAPADTSTLAPALPGVTIFSPSEARWWPLPAARRPGVAWSFRAEGVNATAAAQRQSKRKQVFIVVDKQASKQQFD
mmetsp:Transcript_2528/g.6283  ORF Transcript_2528/g.6283 Transcript_2528/m.6283 type:complete len:83 (+) Transcript_2528:605-853(+)